MRLIDADRLKKKFCHHCEDDGKCKEQCFDLDIIDTTPTIDAVQVVRCKDCKHYENGEYEYCNHNGIDVHKEDFCSFGERRRENEV